MVVVDDDVDMVMVVDAYELKLEVAVVGSKLRPTSLLLKSSS